MSRTPLLPSRPTGRRTAPRTGAARTRALGAGVLAAAAALSLAACGPSSSTTSSASTPSPSATSGGQGRGARNPGTTGLIAQVSGGTMQVQTRTDQTAVTFTSSTKVTKTVTGSAKDVTVGSCVLVRENGGAGSSSESSSGSVTAASVTVAAATAGSCRATAFGGGSGAFAGRGGNGGGRAGAGGTPTGAPTSGPGGNGGNGGGAGGFGGFGGVTFGSVTAVSGSGFTVSPVARGGAGAGVTSTTSAGSPVTVTTTSTTSYLLVEAGTSADVRTGECVTATGKADDTGTVAATALSLRPAVNGSCSLGGGRRAGAGGTGSSATTGASNA